MEQNTFHYIQDIIKESPLSHDEQRDFIELFAQTKETALKPVLKLFVKDNAWVARLYENYQEKKEAMVTGNMAAWSDAIEKEKEVLEQG